jgi:catechol 2,3-dioxygenase-like lactoylglutathione lyase family enzyme
MLCQYHAYAMIPAADLSRARRFYEEVLGFEPARVTDSGVQYNARGSVVYLYKSAYAGTNQATVLSLEVEDDLGPLVADLRRRGVKFEEYDLSDAGIKTSNGIYTYERGSNAWFKDTEGNIIGLVKSVEPMEWPADEVLVGVGAGSSLDPNEDF